MFAEIIRAHKIKGPPETPYPIQTTLGYIIIGSVFPKEVNSIRPSHSSFFSLDSLVEKMWELEDYSPPVPKKEVEFCENLFIETVT